MALGLRVAALAVTCVLALAASDAMASTAPITTLAGSGQNSPFPAPESGAGSYPALTTPFSSAFGAATLSNFGNAVVFADPNDNRILQLNGTSVYVAAGTGIAGKLGDGGAPTDARLNHPQSVDLFQVGYLIADTGNMCVRIITGAGLGSPTITRDSGACDPSQAAIMDATPALNGAYGDPIDVAVWPGSSDFTEVDYYVADSYFVRQVSGTGGSRSLTTVAGTGSSFTPPADGGSPTSGYIGFPTDVAVTSSASTYYIASADSFHGINRVFEVTGGKIYTVAGLGTGDLGDGGAAVDATLDTPTSVLPLADGGFLVYDGGHARIRRVSGGASPTIETIAGAGTIGGSPDGTPADTASLRASGHLALFPSGLIFTQTDASTGGLVREIPSTAIVSGPSGAAASTSATFGLASWDDDATYECKLDTGSFGPCAASSGLSQGPHTFQARATTNHDAGGGGGTLDTTGASRTWTVDTVAPEDFGLVSPDDQATVPPKPSFTWAAATDVTTQVERYELWIDGAKAADVPAASCCSADAPRALSDGSHTWQVKAFDSAGNVRTSVARAFTVNTPPVASLTIAPTPALVGRVVTFDGSASSDANGTIKRYEWDLDGDGTFETDTGTTPKTTRSYDKPATIKVSLRVTDDSGLTGTASGTLSITSTPPLGKQLGVSINDGAQFTNDPNVTVFCAWPGFATDMLFSNDGGFKQAQVFPVAATQSWTLESSGPERLPKTIYVRFVAGSQTSETYTDDIILDQTPPKVVGATIAGAASSTGASAAAAKRVTLKIRATDNVSGVGAMQITSNKKKPGRLLKYKRTVKVKPAKALYVRARDRAGNFSPWRKAAKR